MRFRIARFSFLGGVLFLIFALLLAYLLFHGIVQAQPATPEEVDPIDILTNPNVVFSTAAFLAAWVISIVQLIKRFVPALKGPPTLIVAVVLSFASALVGQRIGLVPGDIAAAIAFGFSAAFIAAGGKEVAASVLRKATNGSSAPTPPGPGTLTP